MNAFDASEEAYKNGYEKGYNEGYEAGRETEKQEIDSNPNVSYLCIDKNNYRDEKDFWEAISNIIKHFTDNNYIAHIRYEDCGIYRIEYTHENLELGDVRYVAMTAEQEEAWRDTL